MTTIPIPDAIAQARKVAEDNVPIEAWQDPTGTIIPLVKPSMASVAASTGVIPRNAPYLKVNEFGILIGKQKKGFLDGFRAQLLLVEDKGFQLKWTLRFGNPAQYLSTYDGQSCDKGGTWIDAMLRARMIDPKVEPYVSVDVVLTLSEDLKAGDETLRAGTQVGFNSSKTNFSEWADFHAFAAERGLIGEEVAVEIGHRAVAHNGNNWGVVTFALGGGSE
jgi:hypothetical protein